MINSWVRGETIMKNNNSLVEYIKKNILAASFRIIFPLFLAFILFALSIFLIFVPSLKKNMIDQKKEMINELNDSSCTLIWSLLSEYNQRVLSGELTLDDAQARVKKRIRNLRYGPESEDYFWIIDTKARVILHPFMSDLEGRDQTNGMDALGKYIHVAFVTAAQMKGSGYVDYLWQGKEGSPKKVPKIAYVKLFEPWGWVIGTSIYVDEIHSKIQVITHRLFKIFAGVLIIVLVLSVYITWQAMEIAKKGHQAEKAHRLDSLRLKKLRELNQMAEASLEDLTAFSLEEAIKLTRSCIGYLVFLNDDETEVTLHTWSNNFFMESNIPGKEKIYKMEQTGLWGEAVRQRRSVIINDYKNMDSGHKKGYPKGHVSIIRYMNIPVFDGGKIVAVASVGNKKENYNKSDVRQLNLLMDGMWKIIHRKRSEVALRKSEERYRLLTDNVSDNIWTLQLSDMCLTYVSPSVEKIMGYTPEQILKLSFKDCMTKGSFKKVFIMVSEELKKENEPGIDPKRSRVTQLEQIRKDGSMIWTEITTCFLRDEAGKADRMLGVTRDITERRKMERQLQQSQKMEAIGTLAGGIAHDFNNILSSILGFTELAKMKSTHDPAMAEKLDKIFASGIRARDLVRHILAFSRQQEVHRESIFIVPLLKECMGFLRASIPRTIEIVQDFNADGCAVMADASQIHQIIMNLCTNAAHSMRGKSGLLEVCLKQVEIESWERLPAKGLKQGRYLKLTVADSGCGIPEQIVERIFEPFFTTKECGEGTGMGLSLVHGIIKDMGGAIYVYSELGKGTAFQVFFPVHRCRATEVSPSGNIFIKGTGRILLVDDEEDIVISGRSILMTMGYDVVGVTCATEALDLFKETPDGFDLVLTDVTMPKMTGIALSKAILTIRKDIPIVLMTGFSEGATSQLENIGVFGTVMKPVIARELAQVIHTALGDT